MFGIFRRAISLSELRQLFALQTSVSVVAFARALSSSSGAYQLRATVRRPYRRTREGRRGESLVRNPLSMLSQVICLFSGTTRAPARQPLWWSAEAPEATPWRSTSRRGAVMIRTRASISSGTTCARPSPATHAIVIISDTIEGGRVCQALLVTIHSVEAIYSSKTIVSYTFSRPGGVYCKTRYPAFILNGLPVPVTSYDA